MTVLECVVNVSEGREPTVIDAIAAAASGCLLDVHSDPHHNRTVLTLGGPAAAVEQVARAVAREAVRRIDLRAHVGVHPRLGAVDVVPFVPLNGATIDDALAARNRFATWAGTELGVPGFLYGPERPLPQVRRQAFVELWPDTGPPLAHPTAGAMCVGARPVLVAYNLWLAPGVSLDRARAVVTAIRGPSVRALALDVGGRAQVSCNLVEPDAVGPAEVYDAVAEQAEVQRAELVGLVPTSVLDRTPLARWAELGLDPDLTIEARLMAAGSVG